MIFTGVNFYVVDILSNESTDLCNCCPVICLTADLIMVLKMLIVSLLVLLIGDMANLPL